VQEAVRPRALLYMPLFQNIGRVYTNSFLAALNLRTYFAAGARADHGAGARAGRGAGASAAPDSFVLPQFVAREAIETDAGDAGASVGELGTAEDGAKPVRGWLARVRAGGLRRAGVLIRWALHGGRYKSVPLSARRSVDEGGCACPEARVGCGVLRHPRIGDQKIIMAKNTYDSIV
jgi:hypothetical protein